MLKAPIPGCIKTRLAATIGSQAACRAYQKICEYLLAELSGSYPTEIHHAPSDAQTQATMEAWLGKAYAYFPQSDGDLGRRMDQAVQGALSRGAQAVVLLGGDCPYITKATLKTIAAALKDHDGVVGPAADGGYYLLALKAPQPFLFDAIPWSTPHVLSLTLERAQERGLLLKQLEVREDVDDFISWRRAQIFLSKEEGKL